MLVGLTNLLTDPFTLTNIADGLFFYKGTASTSIAAYVRGSSVSQNVAAVGIAANATQIILGIYVDVNGNFNIYVNDSKITTIATTAANFPAVNLMPVAGIKNGAAAIKTLNLDYILASKFRQ
jgi:Holliday junction resolvase